MPVNVVKLPGTIFTFIIALSLGIFTCSASTLKNENIQDSAEIVLKSYLELRKSGLYKECENYFSAEYLDEFKNNHGTSYANYFQNHNEDLYHDSEIKEKVTRKDGSIKIILSTTVEGPGYISRATEMFLLNQQSGVWKIVDWKIDYKD